MLCIRSYAHPPRSARLFSGLEFASSECPAFLTRQLAFRPIPRRNHSERLSYVKGQYALRAAHAALAVAVKMCEAACDRTAPSTVMDRAANSTALASDNWSVSESRASIGATAAACKVNSS